MTKNKRIRIITETPKEKASLVCSYRLFLALLAFSGVFLCYAQRREDFLSINFSNASKKTNDTITLSFALGYVLTHVPSAIAGNLIGPQRFFALIIFFSSIFTGLLPIFHYHANITMLLCFLIGATQGGLWPTLFRFWSAWAPAFERTTLLSFQIAGPSISAIVLWIFNFLSQFSESFIARYGWIYYLIFGCLGIIWSFIWLIFSSDTPMINEHISAKEKEYIQACKIDERIQDMQTKTPWVSIFQSRTFWCIVITMFFREIGVYASWRIVPQYMNKVLEFDINKSDHLGGILHIAIVIGILFTGISSDFIIRNNYLKRVNIRKIFHGIGCLTTTICLLVILFLYEERINLVICLYMIGIVLNDFMKSGGYFVNILDFSGVHSSVVLALGETLSSLGTLCALRLTDFIVKNDTATEWKLASILCTVAFIFAFIMFSSFAHGEPESWACEENNELIEMDYM